MNVARCTVLVFLVMASCAAMAERPSGSDVGSNLPPRVRALLVQEMNAILDATRTMLGALVRGQDDIVARNARAIYDSFIMKQEMTEADRQALLDAVPDAFLERDRAFHELSARLAQAAGAGDKARQRELFAGLVDSCAGCHSEHAVDRFPGFGAVD